VIGFGNRLKERYEMERRCRSLLNFLTIIEVAEPFSYTAIEQLNREANKGVKHEMDFAKRRHK
jgi:hypothetical protein